MHDRIAINHLCFIADPFPKFVEQVRALGAKRVSFMGHVLLGEGGVDAAKTMIAEGGYAIETITQPFQIPQHISADEATWVAPRAQMTRMIDIAAEIGAPSVYMVTGGHGSLVWEEAARCFSDALAPCVTHAKSRGVQLLIEPTNPHFADINIAHSLADTILLAEMAGIGVCLDLYASWTCSNLKGLISRAMPIMGTVQVADYIYGDRTIPDRGVPGDGAIPLERIIGWILEAGYQGGFDMELGFGPRMQEEGYYETTRRAADYMTNLLDRLGA